MFLFGEIHVCLQIICVRLFGTTEPVSRLKNLSFLKYSLQKLTQSSELNNVLDPAASNTDKQIYFPLTSRGLFGTYQAYLHFEKPKLQEGHVLKPNFSWGNNMLDACSSNTDGFLW
jgi:hypothetical protein